ncbi:MULTISPECIES: hypothetical protein [unclassified Bradyrhizobium]|uniref:hypothetical protein n=1 Tax=unclassified Bradyrhizobium TaxID=2631580 RepID=UPI002916B7C7|nr:MULTISPECIES: hypothetical protein [unclassified Bradyrhizobium]
MIADFTFKLAHLSYHIDGEGHRWLARCAGNVPDLDNFSVRGAIPFLDGIPVDIAFKLRKDGSLDHAMMTPGLDGQIAQRRQRGYRCDSDAYILHFFPKEDGSLSFLGMTTVLTEVNFARFHEFMLRHIGRSDLSARLICPFHGFSNEYSKFTSIPTKQQFLEGQPYFEEGEQTIAIGSNLP